MTTSTALEPIRVDPDGVKVFQVGTLEVRNFDRLTPAVRNFVLDVAGEVASSSEDAQMQIIDGILNADSPEKAMASADIVHGEAMIGKVYTVHGVKWNRSKKGGGLPFYAVVEISTDDNPAHLLMTTSSLNVMAAVWKFNAEGWLPVEVRHDEAREPTPDGNKPQRLVPPSTPEPF